MTPTIRDARPGDAVAITDAHVAAWAAAYRGLVADDILDGEAFRRARVEGWTNATCEHQRERDDPQRRLIVSEIDGQVVGFSIFGRERHRGDHSALGDERGSRTAPAFIPTCGVGAWPTS